MAVLTPAGQVNKVWVCVDGFGEFFADEQCPARFIFEDEKNEAANGVITVDSEIEDSGPLAAPVDTAPPNVEQSNTKR